MSLSEVLIITKDNVNVLNLETQTRPVIKVLLLHCGYASAKLRLFARFVNMQERIVKICRRVRWRLFLCYVLPNGLHVFQICICYDGFPNCLDTICVLHVGKVICVFCVCSCHLHFAVIVFWKRLLHIAVKVTHLVAYCIAFGHQLGCVCTDKHWWFGTR